MTADSEHLLRVAGLAIEEYEIRGAELRRAGGFAWADLEVHKYRVRSRDRDERYLLTINYPMESAGIGPNTRHLESQLLWVEALHQDTDLVVQLPVRNRQGDLLTVVRDPTSSREAICSLAHWVEGEPLWNEGADVPPADLAEKLGRVLARLHQHARHWELPAGFQRPSHGVSDIKAWLQMLQRAVDDGRVSVHDLDRIRAALQRLVEKLAQLGESADVWGLVHGDLDGSNCVVYDGYVCPIDFDGCGFTYYLREPGWALANMREGSEDRVGRFRQALLSGYGAARELTPDDLVLIEGFVIETRVASWCETAVGDPSQDLDELPQFARDTCAKYAREEPFLL